MSRLPSVRSLRALALLRADRELGTAAIAERCQMSVSAVGDLATKHGLVRVRPEPVSDEGARKKRIRLGRRSA